jgi:hypothetical protein
LEQDRQVGFDRRPLFDRGQLLYGNGNNALSSVATTTFTPSGEFTTTGTLGALIGGSNSTLSLATNGVALTKIAQIAAGTILGNPTGATGNVQAIATSTLFGAGTNGFVLAQVNGIPTWTATTTFSGGLTYANGNVTNSGVTSLAGTANQISVSGATGAVTLSIPTQFNISNASTTNFSANTLAVGATGTTSISSNGTLTIQSLNGLLKATNGVVSSATPGVDYANFAYLFPGNATSTLLNFNGGASTTAISANTAAFGGTGTTSISSTGALTTPSLTIGALNGNLQAVNGVVSATSTLSAAFGGTGFRGDVWTHF